MRLEETISWIQQYELDIVSIKRVNKGEDDLAVMTEDDVSEPLNRRVELYIR